MRTLVVLALALVGCGDGNNTEPAIDAPPSIDAPSHPLVGTWTRQVYNDVDRTTLVSFSDRGVLRWGDDFGTWGITVNGYLKAGAPPSRPVSAAPFYLSPDHNTLMMIAMLPTTPTDGLVGTWKGDFEYADGTPVTSTMEFRADHTLTWTDTKFGVDRTDEGTWTLEEDENVLIQAVLGGTTPVNVGMRLIPDAVLGSDLLFRSQ